MLPGLARPGPGGPSS
uniref:Uncharacterized protein n=1 Tax=Arundo donax TaxID=35708 RepID=A0A0A9API7_ARUDO